MILGIIFVAVFNEFGNVNFQLVVIQPWKYTYLHGFTRDIVLRAFIDFCLLESRNADSETAGGPALLSINIFEHRIRWARFTRAPKRGPGLVHPKSSGVARMQLPASRLQVLTSRPHYPVSKLQHPDSRPRFPGFQGPWMAGYC